MLQYKGYTGRVEFDDRAEIFHGEVCGLRDVITFQGRSAKELKMSFSRLDRRLPGVLLQTWGRQPDKPFSGKNARANASRSSP